MKTKDDTMYSRRNKSLCIVLHLHINFCLFIFLYSFLLDIYLYLWFDLYLWFQQLLHFFIIFEVYIIITCSYNESYSKLLYDSSSYRFKLNYIINIILVRFNNTLINIVMVTVIKNFVWIEAIIPTGTSTIWCAWNFQLMATTTRWTFQELCSHTEKHLTTLVKKEELSPTKVCYIYIWRRCLPCCLY